MLGVVMRHLARTPCVRLIVIGNQVRALAIGPPGFALSRYHAQRVLVPAAEHRTWSVPLEIASIA